MSAENVSSSQVPTPVPIQVPSVPAQAPSLPDIDLRHSYILPDPINNVFGALEEISYVDDIDTRKPYKLCFSATFEGELFRVAVYQFQRSDGQQIVKFICNTLHVDAEFNSFLRALLGRLRNNGIMCLDGSALPSWY
jgi:hypothetical protein